MEQQIRDILDQWEVGMITHWQAMTAIRQIVGGDSRQLRDRLFGPDSPSRKPQVRRGNRK